MALCVPLQALITRSMRFSEYAVPFVVLTAGVWIAAMSRSPRAQLWLAARARIARAAGIALLAALALMQGATLHSDLNHVPGTWYPGLTHWLSTHDEARGKFIYNAGWSTFPELFLARADCDYAAGLDPAFVGAAGTRHSHAWVRIAIKNFTAVAPDGRGLVKYLRDEVGADYIFLVRTDNSHLYFGMLQLAQAGVLGIEVRDPADAYALFRLR
jgi:hypothetical protein